MNRGRASEHAIGNLSVEVRTKLRLPKNRVTARDRAKRVKALKDYGVPAGHSVLDKILMAETNEDQAMVMRDFCKGIKKPNG